MSGFISDRLKPLVILVTMALCMCLTGCGRSDRWVAGRPPVYPASGTVMMNGQPLEGATVIFSPEETAAGKPGFAVTDSYGHFQAETFEPKDGLTSGFHKVAIEKTIMVDKQGNLVREIREPGDAIEKREVPRQYSDFEKSGFRVEVKADGKNQFEAFELKK